MAGGWSEQEVSDLVSGTSTKKLVKPEEKPLRADVEKAYEIIKGNKSIDRSGTKYPEFANAENILKADGWSEREISDLRRGTSTKKLPAKPSSQEINDMQDRLQRGGLSDAEREGIEDTLRAEGIDVIAIAKNQYANQPDAAPVEQRSKQSAAPMPKEFLMGDQAQQPPVPSEFLMTNSGKQQADVAESASAAKSWNDVRDSVKSPEDKLVITEMQKYFSDDQKVSRRVMRFFDKSTPVEEKRMIVRELVRDGIDLPRIQNEITSRVRSQSKFPRKYESPAPTGKKGRGLDV
jgi:hypothetical protein